MHRDDPDMFVRGELQELRTGQRAVREREGTSRLLLDPKRSASDAVFFVEAREIHDLQWKLAARFHHLNGPAVTRLDGRAKSLMPGDDLIERPGERRHVEGVEDLRCALGETRDGRRSQPLPLGPCDPFFE